MSAFDVVRIRDIWKRVFGMDIEKRRRAVDLPSVAVHLNQFEKRHFKPALVDQLLVEIDTGGETVKGEAKKKRRLPPRPEPKEPGITPGDVFRIFGNSAQTILTEADWQEISEADRRAIEEEAAHWALRDGVFLGDQQWQRVVPRPGTYLSRNWSRSGVNQMTFMPTIKYRA